MVIVFSLSNLIILASTDCTVLNLNNPTLANTSKSVFLCDSEKFDKRSIYTLTTIDNVDYAVFDTAWDKLKTKCKLL